MSACKSPVRVVLGLRQSGRYLALFTLLVALVCAPGTAFAQTIVGQINGTVQDSSGGRLPGVTVTTTSEGTGLVRNAVTDGNGGFTITNLPIGTYTVSAELEGFKKVQQAGYVLTADGRLTANLTLEVGALTEVVEVAAVAGEKINATSGEIARTVDSQQIRDLAFNGRNYMELASLIPGAAATNFDPLELATSLSVTGQSINGSRGNTNNLTIDGGQNLDSGSNGSQVNNVGLSFIEQVKIQTSNFSAELGRNSGAAINVVTKSGTNRLSGTARYDFRDERFDKANYFAPRDSNGNRTKPDLEFKNFEGALGGPLLRNKLFFFGGQQYRTINRFTTPTRRTMPTQAELNGDYSQSYILRGPDNVVGTGDDLRLLDPLTGQPFPGNRIPADRITADGRAFANAYRRMIDLAAVYSDTPTPNNATYQLANPFETRQDVLRFDWQVNNRQSLYGRYIHDDYTLLDPYGVFSGAQLPSVPTNRNRPGTSYQVAHTFVLSPTLVNEAKISAAWNSQHIDPQGEDWKRSTYGFAFPELYSGNGFIPDGIPNVTMTGYTPLQGPSFALMSPTTDITIQDVLTYTRGAHSIRTGFAVSRNRKDQNGRSNFLGAVTFNPAGNPQTTNNAMADALLGNFRTYSEASSDPVGFFRFTAYQAFVSDTWRVSPKLSVEAGVRFERQEPTYTSANNIVNFDPSIYDPSQAVTLRSNGTIVPGSGFRFNGLVRAGDGIPSDQTGRAVPLTGGDYDRIPQGAPRGLYKAQNLFMPRLSFAYSLNDATVIRAGGGLFYDKPEGNLIFSALNIPPFLDSATYENFNIANPAGGAAGALAPIGNINAISPDLVLPSQVNYSVSMQRELGGGYFLEAAYVGNQGRNLLRQPDVNQVPFEVLFANNALPAAQRASENALRPYKGFSQIRMYLSDSSSEYNSMQLYFTKRRGALTFTLSYTLSKATTDSSGNTANPEDYFNRAFSYGLAEFDRRHAFVSTFTYRVPFFRDQGGLKEGLAGGWEVSGKTRYQTGQHFTALSNSSTGNRRADYLGGDVTPADQDENNWFNKDAFGVVPNDRRGTATVGQIAGPDFYQWDLSFRKDFRFAGRFRLTPIIDVFNLFNRLNLSNIDDNGRNVSNASYGTIASANPPRQMQFGLRFDF